MEKSRVSLVRCGSYNTDEVMQAVKRSVDLLGGIANFVKPSDKVLIKPNILSARRPEDAVCTHPEVVRAVIKLVKGRGADVVVGDSPGGFINNVEEVYEVSGIAKVARDEKVDLVKFAFTKTVDGFPLSVRVLQADKVISIPKFKTHEVTGITAAIKNMYGALSGLYKTQCHAMAPREKEFAKIIVKVFSLVKPALNIIDAVWSMEGEGPSAGEPRKTDFLMAGSDAAAIDSLLAVLIGQKPYKFSFIKECRIMRLGETDISNIDILGDRFSDFSIKDFKLAKGMGIFKYMPKYVADIAGLLLRFWPEIDNETCKKCNLCRSSCPVRAIYVQEGGFYTVDLSKCINCMCCREICPYKAVRIKRSWLARMIWE